MLDGDRLRSPRDHVAGARAETGTPGACEDMTKPPTSRRLQCEACGSAFALEVLPPEVSCPFCGRLQQVADLRAELEHHGVAVGQHLESAARDYQGVASWERIERRSDPSTTPAVVLGLMVVVPLLIAGGSWLAFELDLIGSPNVTTSVVGGSFLGIITFVMWAVLGRRNVEATTVAPAQTPVACPNCGAYGVLTGGQGIDTCTYCGASLIPSTTAMRSSIDAAARAAQKARMTRHRAERESLVRIVTYDESPFALLIPLLIFGSVPLTFFVTAAVYSWPMVTGTTEFHPGIFAPWAVLISLGALTGYFASRRSRKRDLWRRALADLSRQFGGRVVASGREWVAWLNTYWTGEYPVSIGRKYGASASLQAYGYPVLVISDDLGALFQQTPPILEVLLAAAMPHLPGGAGATAQNAERAAAQARLESQGFEISMSEAGVTARAGVAYKRLYDHRAAAHLLAPVLRDLATLAWSAGAEPVEAIAL
jgi:hypothetical protein